MVLVDAQTVGVLVTATSVTVAAVYYITTLRVQQTNMKHTLETRQADILQRHAQIGASQDFMDAWCDVVMKQYYLTYEEWLRYYGPEPNPDAYTHYTAIIQYYECLGGLVRENLANIELVERIWQPLHLICVWDRVEPVINAWRRNYRDGSIYENLEFLFNKYLERHPAAVLTRSVRHGQMVEDHDEWIKSLVSK